MSISPKKILIVHGEKDERGKLAIMLSRFGHCVSFSDGMKKPNLSLTEYDLIIVDEYLAGGAGFIFMQQLSIKLRAKTIFLSSANTAERRLCQDSMSIYECLKKPVKPNDLVVVVCDFFISNSCTQENIWNKEGLVSMSQ